MCLCTNQSYLDGGGHGSWNKNQWLLILLAKHNVMMDKGMKKEETKIIGTLILEHTSYFDWLTKWHYIDTYNIFKSLPACEFKATALYNIRNIYSLSKKKVLIQF